MIRREFIALLGGAAAFTPLAAHAQPDRVRLIGALSAASENDTEGQARIEAFREGLKALGWIEGRNIHIEYRWAKDSAQLPVYAAELVALKPELIFAASGTPLDMLRRATSTIPIIFSQVPDPVGRGYVQSLARPGGNITGFTLFEMSIAVKWLELLKQIDPRVTAVGVLYDPANSAATSYRNEIDAGAPTFGVKLFPVAVRNGDEIEQTLATLATQSNAGFVVLPGPSLTAYRDIIVAQAARHRLPAVYPFQYFAKGGGLASYGVDNHDLFRRAASYVDRVLKGDNPGELPVQQAVKFELVINMKTAKALGIEVPVSLLARTDEVIE